MTGALWSWPSRRGTLRRRVALCAVVVSVVLGAGGPASASPAAPPTAPDVMPKGAQIVHPAPPSPPACQNPTASFPPPATMPTPGAMPAGSYMAQIKARGYLRVGVDQNTYLWGYRDPSTGLLTGFDVSMLQQVSLAIFGPTGLSHIQYVVVPNKSRIPEVQSGRVDILAETMTINCEREKKIDFSTVYYEAGQKILVSTNSKITGPQDLGGKRVCATTGSTSLRNLVASGMPRDIQLWAVNNETDCLVMLQQGQVDAISTDDAILLGLAAQDPNTRVVPPTAFSQEPYGLAISKAHPGFTSFVNGVLAQVRADGAWTQIYDANLEPYTKDPVVPAPPMPSYR